MNKPSRISLPHDRHVDDTRHAFAVNERVKCINADHDMYNCHGTIINQFRHVLTYPAYDVLWDEWALAAMSERSLERIEDERTSTEQCPLPETQVFDATQVQEWHRRLEKGKVVYRAIDRARRRR